MWEKVNNIVSVLWKNLVGGLFSLLPAFLFAGLIGGLAAAFGLEDKVNSDFFFMYAGACGGFWLRKKLILKKLEGMGDDQTKWNIYRNLEKE
jgi:hypothetical protein